MKIKYGKSSKNIQKLKEDYFSENEKNLNICKVFKNYITPIFYRFPHGDDDYHV